MSRYWTSVEREETDAHAVDPAVAQCSRTPHDVDTDTGEVARRGDCLEALVVRGRASRPAAGVDDVEAVVVAGPLAVRPTDAVGGEVDHREERVVRRQHGPAGVEQRLAVDRVREENAVQLRRRQQGGDPSGSGDARTATARPSTVTVRVVATYSTES